MRFMEMQDAIDYVEIEMGKACAATSWAQVEHGSKIISVLCYAFLDQIGPRYRVQVFVDKRPSAGIEV